MGDDDDLKVQAAVLTAKLEAANERARLIAEMSTAAMERERDACHRHIESLERALERMMILEEPEPARPALFEELTPVLTACATAAAALLASRGLGKGSQAPESAALDNEEWAMFAVEDGCYVFLGTTGFDPARQPQDFWRTVDCASNKVLNRVLVARPGTNLQVIIRGVEGTGFDDVESAEDSDIPTGGPRNYDVYTMDADGELHFVTALRFKHSIYEESKDTIWAAVDEAMEDRGDYVYIRECIPQALMVRFSRPGDYETPGDSEDSG